MENDNSQNKQAVVKEAWLGNFVDRELHPSAVTAAARMRIAMFRALTKDWVHPFKLKRDGKTYQLWVLGHQETKREFLSPVAETKLAAVADKAATDGWDPQGHELDFRVFEPVTLEGRVLAGGPFIYGSRIEAEEALTELLLEGAAISLAKDRDEGTLVDAITSWEDHFRARVEKRRERYSEVNEDVI